MFHDRKYHEIMHSPEEATLKWEGMERHTKGKDIPDDNVEVTCIYSVHVHVHVHEDQITDTHPHRKVMTLCLW